MFCSKCGAALPQGALFCSLCGQAANQSLAMGAQSASQFVTPAPDAQTSGKALASMITGIFGVLLFFPAIAAIILGHISLVEIRKSNGRLKGKGMATAGLVMGYGIFAMIPFILIIAAIAIPNLLRARIAANEASSVASIRTINTAEIEYNSAYPAVGFTCRLASLGGNGGSPSAERAQLIDNLLASGRKSGYQFVLQNCVNNETDHKYQVLAYPQARNQSGVRTFCSDESGVVRYIGDGSPEDCLTNGSELQ